jgi:hypothetical protein
MSDIEYYTSKQVLTCQVCNEVSLYYIEYTVGHRYPQTIQYAKCEDCKYIYSYQNYELFRNIMYARSYLSKDLSPKSIYYLRRQELIILYMIQLFNCNKDNCIISTIQSFLPSKLSHTKSSYDSMIKGYTKLIDSIYDLLPSEDESDINEEYDSDNSIHSRFDNNYEDYMEDYAHNNEISDYYGGW